MCRMFWNKNTDNNLRGETALLEIQQVVASLVYDKMEISTENPAMPSLVTTMGRKR